MLNNWHTKSAEEVLKEFITSETGLSEEKVKARFNQYGLNKLPSTKTESALMLFLRQFHSPLIYILFAASLIVFLLGEATDSAIIIFVLLFNAVVGAIQEGKAKNTLLSLKKFVQTQAVVRRGGKEIIISDEKIVPGDIIVLREGDKIPADARIIVSNNLKIDEASLTGESEPVEKNIESLKNSNLPVSEQRNMVFKGTFIAAGNGRAVVTATGSQTEIGKISEEIILIDSEVPLKKEVDRLTKLIIIVVSVMNVFLLSAGFFLGKNIKEMFMTAVSLSVSVIPEGLPIVMTLVLAVGVKRMSRRNALVKRLQAVEALGQASIIAVDKTGTITKNELTVKKIFVDNEMFEVDGVGYELGGGIKTRGNAIDPINHLALVKIGRVAALSAKAKLFFFEKTNKYELAGDPTEAALLVLAEKIGFHKEELEKEMPLVAEFPLNYKTKFQASIHKFDKNNFLAVSGAPEAILELSSKIYSNGKDKNLTPAEKKKLENKFLTMSADGLRIIALAFNDKISEKIKYETVENFVFLGFIGMRDEIRPEASEAILKVEAAGIKVVMITGDHKITAKVIAEKAGIYKQGDEILTGAEIEKMTDKELTVNLKKISVFARVTPEHKLRIIKAYKEKGHIVAMTGDGVNDAPSLVAADLGVAMGKNGTEVAAAAADIVLLDDNFSSIVAAIEEGRNIYKTIKKVILYLFSTNTGEVLTIIGALFIGYPLPLWPAQILWLNLVTDGFLDVALAMDNKEKGLLSSRFEKPKKYLVDSLMLQRVAVMAVPMAAGALWLFHKYYQTDLLKAWTITLTTLAVFHWFNAFNCRSDIKSIFQINPFSNKFLIGAVMIVVSLQLFAIYHPWMQAGLKTAALSVNDWLLIIPVAASIFLFEELRKGIYRLKTAS